MCRTTINAVNRAIAEAGFEAELVKATGGYFYFAGPAVELAHETGVAVYRLSDLTVDQWVSRLRAIIPTEVVPGVFYHMAGCMEEIHGQGFVEFGSRIVAETFAKRLRSNLPTVPVRVAEVGGECEEDASMWRVVAEAHPL